MKKIPKYEMRTYTDEELEIILKENYEDGFTFDVLDEWDRIIKNLEKFYADPNTWKGKPKWLKNREIVGLDIKKQIYAYLRRKLENESRSSGNT